MSLVIRLDDEAFEIDVPAALIEEAQDFFTRMDADMDRGWQMSREFVEHLSVADRCRVAADRIHSALDLEKREIVMLMAGYIRSRAPEIAQIDIDTAGEMQHTRLRTADGRLL